MTKKFRTSSAKFRVESTRDVASRRTTSVRQPVLERAEASDLPAPPDLLTPRVVIEHVRPEIDGGRFPIKRTVGESVEVQATIFADGHDVLAAVVRDRPASPPGTTPAAWRETPMGMVNPGLDEWVARFDVSQGGWHEYSIVAWVDRFLTWRRDLDVKAAAGQDVSLELQEGAEANRFTRSVTAESKILRIWVDRDRARFGAWYEMFPRSAGPDASRSGTFQEAAELLPRIADLGFDVVYLPPIHPIGRAFRKGREGTLVAQPGDPGSPWAIGALEGGHTAIEPGLGTLDDFRAFREKAERLGLEVALDLAWQCSPDHPWVREHPQWFRHRADGSIKYAENPPKRYQDIYPLDFESEDWRALWHELAVVTLFWIENGVRIFRVDNPHTKSFGFWSWLIETVQARHPDVIFLAEAFTRPAVMRYLAKAGFTQSYTYFTWRNTKPEIVDWFTDLIETETREYLRPNLFTNTPDILTAYLQQGGRPAFEARLLLAATLGANYGIYSGFELCENRAHPGTEEYVHSEKYEYRKWDQDRPGHIKELIARVNQIRRDQRALHYHETVRFLASDNPHILAYSRRVPDPRRAADASSFRDAPLLVVINLDPHGMQHGMVQIPTDMIESVGGWGRNGYVVHDLLDDVEYRWRGDSNYVRFDPGVRQGHVLRLQIAN
jgi:starch synthase (maltosyl-transferring)